MTPTHRPGNRDRQRAETRQRVYDAALAVFRRDGVAPARIDDIATTAGVSRGTFYFHFPTKDDVLLERYRQSEVGIEDDLAHLAPDAALSEVLDHTAVALAAAWQDDAALLPDVATVALRVLAASVVDREAEPIRALLSPYFRAAAERGEVRGSLPPEILADFYLSNALAAMLAWCAAGTPSLEDTLLGLNQLFLRGVLAG